MPTISDIISGFVFTLRQSQTQSPAVLQLELDVIQHKPTGSQLFGLFCLLFLWCFLKICVCAAVTLPSASSASAFVFQLVVMMLDLDLIS